MILVDVQVLALDQVFDFELDEEMQAGELTEKILRLLIKKSKQTQQPSQPLFLYAVRRDKVLNPLTTLSQQGIESGERLILL